MPACWSPTKVPVAVVAQLRCRAVHQRRVGADAATEPAGCCPRCSGDVAVDVTDTLPWWRPVCVTLPVVCAASACPRWMPLPARSRPCRSPSHPAPCQADAPEGVGGLVQHHIMARVRGEGGRAAHARGRAAGLRDARRAGRRQGCPWPSRCPAAAPCCPPTTRWCPNHHRTARAVCPRWSGDTARRRRQRHVARGGQRPRLRHVPRGLQRQRATLDAAPSATAPVAFTVAFCRAQAECAGEGVGGLVQHHIMARVRGERGGAATLRAVLLACVMPSALLADKVPVAVTLPNCSAARCPPATRSCPMPSPRPPGCCPRGQRDGSAGRREVGRAAHRERVRLRQAAPMLRRSGHLWP